nr:A-kinase anchor protein 4-like [Anolis sagrei ordinatus]XP_060610947.1 A-kinase anchor protein 4-like [Anolis sagrei ordinatus]
MAHELDWLNSQAGMCNVNFYNPGGQKDQECKVVCFVDVANLKDKFPGLNIPTDQPNNISDSTGEVVDIEDKEVVIIKDDEKSGHVNTEGAVCLFKQGSSKDTSVVSWLSNDLQKYALGFQHALSPSGMPCKANVFDTVSQNNNNTAPSQSGSQSGSERPNSEDIAYYANKLCSLVLEMTRKEIKEKWESSGKCTRHTISPYSTEAKSPASESADVSRKPPQERSVKIDDAFTSETVSQNAQKIPDTTYSDKFKMEDATSVSKGMMLYANQVASDMMLSFLKTMKVQKGRRPPPACAVLKEVLIRHAKEVVSDLIDSSMKNLHNITGALMTDSDFVYGLKRNLYNVGTQKTSEVMEAMVKRLFKLLSVDDRHRSQNLTFTSYKTGGQSNQRTQDFQFASLKRESHGQCKDQARGLGKSIPTETRGSDRASMDLYAKELIVAALTQIQQHLLEKTRENRHDCDSNTSSFGYIHRDTAHDGADAPKYSSKPYEGRGDISDSLRGNLILPMIQKILREAGLNLDSQCTDKNQR